MGQTVGPRGQSKRKVLHYGLFFLGIFLLIGALALFLPALQFEFQQGASGEVQRGSGDPVLEYEYLTPQEQRIVDGALDGDTYVLETSQPLPGAPGYAFQPKQMQVNKRGTTYTFIYHTVFPTRSPLGMATIGLAVSGLLAMAEAIRRHHFPNSLPWQTG